MFRMADERRSETREKMRGGDGTVTIRDYFSKEEMQGRARLCSELILPPGSSIGAHDHTGEFEIFLVQRGRGVAVDAGVERTVGPGDAILTGGGTTHTIANRGTEELVLTAVIILA